MNYAYNTCVITVSNCVEWGIKLNNIYTRSAFFPFFPFHFLQTLLARTSRMYKYVQTISKNVPMGANRHFEKWNAWNCFKNNFYLFFFCFGNYTHEIYYIIHC